MMLFPQPSKFLPKFFLCLNACPSIVPCLENLLYTAPLFLLGFLLSLYTECLSHLTHIKDVLVINNLSGCLALHN